MKIYCLCNCPRCYLFISTLIIRILSWSIVQIFRMTNVNLNGARLTHAAVIFYQRERGQRLHTYKMTPDFDEFSRVIRKPFFLFLTGHLLT